MKGALYAAIIVLTSITPALAAVDPVRVPEPTTVGLLSVGAAVVALGARWFHRK